MSTRTIRFLIVLWLAICFSSCGAHAQDLSASDVLKKVAETYRQASSYSVVAEKTVEQDTEARYTDVNGNLLGSSVSGDVEITLMVSSSSKAKLQLKAGKTEGVVVSDGKLVWTLIPTQHAYTEVSAGGPNTLSNDISGVHLLEEYKTLIAARFQSITDNESWAKLEHSETLKVGKDKRQCYVLTIQKPKGAHKQKLWVDTKEFTIWKSVDTTRSSQDYMAPIFDSTTTVTTKQMALNPSLDDSNFVFTAPEQAKKVDSLILSGGNPF